ncbi:hypothetical protein M9X92_009215 [Pyricularia oryzae]|nr:hypothetical protein M9X92_009215 [Pyricularia oryzae]
MTIFLLRLCFLSACSNILLNENQLNLLRAYIATRRVLPTPFKSRSRRSNSAPSSPPGKGKRRRASSLAFNPEFLHHVSQSFARSRAAYRRPRAKIENERGAGEALFAPMIMEDPPCLGPSATITEASKIGKPERLSTAASEAITTPVARSRVSSGCTEEELEIRSVRLCRSNSSTAHHRLSLTLPIPIALPTASPTRPTLASSAAPTPADTPLVQSPTDSGGFITAIAAQERRVLELREELQRAEKDLQRLKRQFEHHEAHKKRQEARASRPLRIVTPTSLNNALLMEKEDASARRNAEVERRKALLAGQQSAPGTPGTPGTPGQSRRRVFPGGHTRQLSLLSPTKSDNGGDFRLHEDPLVDDLKTSSKELDEQFANIVRYAPITPAQLSKRASWAPRTVHQQAASGVKQIAEDFRTGLWTFVEDLRQATVGDEPIHGGAQLRRGFEGNGRHKRQSSNLGTSTSISDEHFDQETIRASAHSTRTHVARAFEDVGTPSPASRFTNPLEDEASSGNRHQRTLSKNDKHAKRFSWTPLSMDSLDDADWLNWESPSITANKSPRWSGSTVTGDTIPEKLDENEPLKQSEPRKLEELPWPALNRLTPSKLKEQAAGYLKELERSLTPPGAAVSTRVDEQTLISM